MNRIDRLMAQLEKRYRREGKSEAWIKSWKRGWYMVGRR